MTKEKTITLYEYSELSEKAQKKALASWNEDNDDPMMQSHMINILKEKLDERGIKYDVDTIDVRYSLSNCQGDGFMFEGKLYDSRENVITIKHDGNAHYYHAHTAEIDYPTASERTYADFQRLYRAICKEMERVGYEHIEYTTSAEAFSEACEANGYTFREDGTMENE